MLSGGQGGEQLASGPTRSSPGRTGGWQLCFSAAHLLGAWEVTLFSRLSLCSRGSPEHLLCPQQLPSSRFQGPQHPSACVCGRSLGRGRGGGGAQDSPQVPVSFRATQGSG